MMQKGNGARDGFGPATPMCPPFTAVSNEILTALAAWAGQVRFACMFRCAGAMSGVTTAGHFGGKK